MWFSAGGYKQKRGLMGVAFSFKTSESGDSGDDRKHKRTWLSWARKDGRLVISAWDGLTGGDRYGGREERRRNSQQWWTGRLRVYKCSKRQAPDQGSFCSVETERRWERNQQNRQPPNHHLQTKCPAWEPWCCCLCCCVQPCTWVRREPRWRRWSCAVGSSSGPWSTPAEAPAGGESSPRRTWMPMLVRLLSTLCVPAEQKRTSKGFVFCVLQSHYKSLKLKYISLSLNSGDCFYCFLAQDKR